MKAVRLFCLIFPLLFLASCGQGSGKKISVETASSLKNEISEISFTEYDHDFGKVKEGEKISYTFHFENKGPGILVITSATTTCGCTVTRYDSEPIPVGKTGSLQVVFNTSGKNGMQTKMITVKSNSRIPVTLLKITADVL